MNIVLRKCNGAVRRYKDLRVKFGVRFLNVGADEIIQKPIFLIGLEGGGLTLLSRILHRNCDVVYLTGNCKYWAGQDEMYNLLSSALPIELTWHNLEQLRFRSRKYGARKHSVLRAADEVLPFYRGTATNVTSETKALLEVIIKKLIALNRPRTVSGPMRFVDKSQLYTVKVGLLHEMLKEYNPKFVLIIRNPFAWTWRMMKYFSTEYLPTLSNKEWLKIASRCWTNNVETALSDGKHANLSVWRFEDLLREPNRVMPEICNFVELKFNTEMMPHTDDRIPLGSLSDAFTHKCKWYPLRPDVNKRYLKNIPDWAVRIIKERCGNLIEKFDYSELGP